MKVFRWAGWLLAAAVVSFGGVVLVLVLTEPKEYGTDWWTPVGVGMLALGLGFVGLAFVCVLMGLAELAT